MHKIIYDESTERGKNKHDHFLRNAKNEGEIKKTQKELAVRT